MGLASKIRNIQTKAEYTISTVPRTNNINSLELGGIISETAIYNGYPSPAKVIRGERPFLVVLNINTLEVVAMDRFHELITKLCTEYEFKTPQDFWKIIVNDVGIDAHLIRKRQVPYGLRKIDILYV